MPSAPFNPSTATAVTLQAGAPLTSNGRTLAGMRQELTRALGDRSDEYTTDELNRWINDGYLDITGMLQETEFSVSGSFNTVANVAQYIFPVKLNIITASYESDEEYTKLAKITDVEAWRQLPNVEDPEHYDYTPTHFFLKPVATGTLIALYPTPFSVLSITVDATAQVTPLVADTDSPLLDPGLHRAVFEMAKRYAFSDLREYDLAGQSQNSAVAIVRSRLDRRAVNRQGVVGRVRVIRDERQLYGRMK